MNLPRNLHATPARVVLACLLAVAASTAAHAQNAGRMLGFSTQDKNGIHYISFSAIAQMASVRLMPQGSDPKAQPRFVPYPVERFDTAWKAIAAIDLARFENKDPNRTVSADDFVLFVSDGKALRSYHVPKCGSPDGVWPLVEKLTAGLLPQGSPGLFHPCAAKPGAARAAQ